MGISMKMKDESGQAHDIRAPAIKDIYEENGKVVVDTGDGKKYFSTLDREETKAWKMVETNDHNAKELGNIFKRPLSLRKKK